MGFGSGPGVIERHNSGLGLQPATAAPIPAPASVEAIKNLRRLRMALVSSSRRDSDSSADGWWFITIPSYGGGGERQTWGTG
jgi:hypothetical protein